MIRQVSSLIDAGFAIHLLHNKSKRPIGNDWQSKPVLGAERLAATYKAGNNLGVRLGKWSNLGGLYLHIIDADIRVPEKADELYAKLTEVLPEFDYEHAPTVISGSGGMSRHFYLVTDKPFPPRKFAHSESFEMVYDKSKDRDVKKWDWELHLLGTGSQAAIPPSIHPDTGLEYTWEREFDIIDLQIGAMKIVAFEAMERLIGHEEGGEVDPEKIKPMGLTDDEIRTYLSELPYDAWFEDRDGWFRTGMALHHETTASVRGFDLWCEFSKKSPKFSLNDSKRVWRSFKNKADRPFRFASVVATVHDQRLENDFEDYGADWNGEDFEDFGDEEGKAEAGMFDDILGSANPKEKKKSRSQEKLAKSNVEDKLGKATPAWITAMNEKHGVARVNGKTVIIDFQDNNEISFGNATELHLFYENDRRPKDDTTVPKSKVWIQHPRRRTYSKGIVFAPNMDVHDAFNLWQGFSVERDPNASCAVFLDHLLNVFCSGNKEHYDYMLKWMAHLVQFPEEKPGVAVIARGKKGVGKDSPFMYIGEMIKHHYITIANRDQMLGKFNSHLEKCLLLHLQEGFWAGDKAAESQLKYIITSRQQLIEPKGLNPFSVQSVLRIFISSNERWVVPASEDERRYFVVNVSDHMRGNTVHFEKFYAEMNSGGPAALLDYLMRIDLSDFKVREVPSTAALGEQKVQGLRNVERWWLEILQNGKIDGAREKDDTGNQLWPVRSVRVSKDDLRENYSMWIRNRRYEGDELNDIEFGLRIKAISPGVQTKRLSPRLGSKRVYAFPALPNCRLDFEHFLGSELPWPEYEDDDEDDVDDLG